MMLVVGDIGGTHSRLARVEAGGLHALRRYSSAAHDSAEALLAHYFDDTGGAPDTLLLAVAGPVSGRRARLTNLPWTVDADALGRRFGLARVELANDFAAQAAGVAALPASALCVLQAAPVTPGGLRVVTGPGTGLGLALVLPDGAVHATEAGHLGFSPADMLQRRLFDWLSGRQSEVTWEHVASGRAFDALYRFVCHEAGAPAPGSHIEGAWVDAQAGQGNPLARATLDLFVAILAAWVAEVARAYRPEGGIVLTGGVARHLAARLASPDFVDALGARPAMRELVANTAVFLADVAEPGLAGAARLAASLTRTQADNTRHEEETTP